ncbi:hypothetical protein HHL21_16960 [Massilia sp. RP-1-19]|uniref:Uncharacterized protein n=1 Tax=Massilia polaris TaxID=2728846 RepID=A0A848HRL1_9BURK|nr:hypothetical protein [Massilia polaris]NML62739.1 hypothetical protein [Massilia polaris]
MDTRNDGLDGPLGTLRNAMDDIDAPRCVEKELMAAFARQHVRTRWHQRIPRLAFAGAGAVAMLAVAAIVVLKAPLRAADGLLQRDEAGFFIALESLERIESEPNPRMIETEVPRMELASLGVPVTPENAGDTVLAEMLVSADGDPLALRLTSTE